jgi:hypothetical protein
MHVCVTRSYRELFAEMRFVATIHPSIIIKEGQGLQKLIADLIDLRTEASDMLGFKL